MYFGVRLHSQAAGRQVTTATVSDYT